MDPAMPGRTGALLHVLSVESVFVSFLWPELGHAVGRKKFREPYSELRLYSFGGLCSGPGKFTRWESFFVSAAGPAASLIFGGLIWILGLAPGFNSIIGIEFISMMLWINVGWAIFNLLPIYPLDGGQMFAAVMANKGRRIVYQVGMITAAIVAVYMLTRSSLFGALLFGSLAYSNYQRSKGLTPRFM